MEIESAFERRRDKQGRKRVGAKKKPGGRKDRDHVNARAMADMGIPVFACTPDLFPDLMAYAISRRDLGQWAASHEIAVARGLG